MHNRHFAPVSLRIYSRRVKIPGTISGTIPLIRSGWECSELNCFQREREKREVSRKKIYRQHPTRGRQKTMFIKDITAVYNDIYWSRKQLAVTPASNEFAREKCPPYTPKISSRKLPQTRYLVTPYSLNVLFTAAPREVHQHPSSPVWFR